MSDFNRVQFVRNLVAGCLDTAEIKMLIIELMNGAEYKVSDVFDVINDVVLFKDFPALAAKLSPSNQIQNEKDAADAWFEAERQWNGQTVRPGTYTAFTSGFLAARK